MRRKDREITEISIIENIIKESMVCRISMVDQNKPYIVPLCFGYETNILYFHGALKGHKIDLMRKNPNVCFEFDLISGTIESENACDWSMKYQSVIGFGRAAFIESPDEKRRALTIIMRQYSDRRYRFPENMLKATAVFKVNIESMTGKRSGF